MGYIRFYFWASILVGLMLAADSVSLLISKVSRWNLLFSYVEYTWLPVSIATIVVLVRLGLPIRVPVSFLVYTLATWLHAFYIVSQHPDPANFRLPAWVAISCGLFGLAFSVLSWMAARSIPRSRVV